MSAARQPGVHFFLGNAVPQKQNRRAATTTSANLLLFMVLCLHATHWDVVALKRRARRSIADLFCTVIQLDLRSLVQHRIVCNSVIAVIAHSFLLNSVAQPAGRDHAKFTLRTRQGTSVFLYIIIEWKHIHTLHNVRTGQHVKTLLHSQLLNSLCANHSA